MRALTALISCLIFSVTAIAQTPAFDPKSWKGKHAGPPTLVLNLGSEHLSQMQKPVTAAMLDPLLDKLAAFNPDIITHEGISGEQCEVLRQYKARYPDMYDSYCWGTEAALAATGLTVPAAMAEAEKILAVWPAKPSASDRRRLAAAFLAANDRPSAQVQWLQLPAADRHAADGIDAAMLKILLRDGAKPNETYEIAVALAARLGLERVYAVDDHTADSIQAMAGPGLAPSIETIWAAFGQDPAFIRFNEQQKPLIEAGNMLGLFRLLNAPETQRLFIGGDFAPALSQETPALYGRQYVAWYETRNLRMVANIRAAFGNKPGDRVLNVVGASHKAYYDAYLDMMHEVELVDVLTVLK